MLSDRALQHLLAFVLGDRDEGRGARDEGARQGPTLLGDAKPPRALVAIRDRATSADRGMRYADANAMGADLARYLDGLAPAAHRETFAEMALRWLANNKAIVALVVAYLVMRVVVFMLR